MNLEPLAVILLSTVGSVVTLVIFYWIIRVAVRHGIEDAWRRRGVASAEAGYWDPAKSNALGSTRSMLSRSRIS
jgi:hypothetical protein